MRKFLNVIEAYTDDPQISMKKLSKKCGVSLCYTQEIIQNYKRISEKMFGIYCVPSLHLKETFYLIKDSGEEKKIEIKDNTVITYLTEEEKNFIKICKKWKVK